MAKKPENKQPSPSKSETPSQPKKHKIDSRKKGKGFERVTAKLLTEWWGASFHSTPASGGLRWGKDARVVGDIVAPEEGGKDFPFSVECKKHEGWNFEQAIKGTGDVTDWWAQCVRDANKVDKVPLLIFSKNRSPVYYMIPLQSWNLLEMRFRDLGWFVTRISYVTDEGDTVTEEVAIGFFEHLLRIAKEDVTTLLGSGTNGL